MAEATPTIVGRSSGGGGVPARYRGQIRRREPGLSLFSSHIIRPVSAAVKYHLDHVVRIARTFSTAPAVDLPTRHSLASGLGPSREPF